MKKIKKAILKADTRTKAILAVMVAYAMIMATTVTTGATSQIKDYIQTVGIQLQDGENPVKDYLVRQDKVGNVLSELDITLSAQDMINKDLNYIVNKDDLLQITRVKEAVVEEVQQIASNHIVDNNGLHLFSSDVVQVGQTGEVKNTYKITYQNGKEVSKEIIGSQVLTEAKDTIVANGTVQSGAYFTGKLTTYGGDCNGCSGGSASGVKLSPTSGVNNTNSAKLNYNGQSYYCLAADPSIPFGTIIEITNHNLSIESTAYGIVVDRGGAIKGNKIDIFKGSEGSGATYFSGGTSNNTQFKIVSVGSGRNFWK